MQIIREKENQCKRAAEVHSEAKMLYENVLYRVYTFRVVIKRLKKG